ncbi:hypothetical protein GF385_04925 [Candidatus Dependentiae bacterium]|nr:hypothetical protein [Candidatus Dependentiae bacterium]
MKLIRKVLILSILAIFSLKPMGFIKNVAQRIKRSIYNPVDVSLNDQTAVRVTNYMNSFRDPFMDRDKFSIVQTRPGNPTYANRRAYHQTFTLGGNGNWIGGHGLFIETQRFLNIARQINFKEKFKLASLISALVCSGIYYFYKNDLQVNIPVLPATILVGTSIVGYNMYKYLKKRSFYKNGGF